jgi:hypothetical protein
MPTDAMRTASIPKSASTIMLNLRCAISAAKCRSMVCGSYDRVRNHLANGRLLRGDQTRIRSGANDHLGAGLIALEKRDVCLRRHG